MKKCSLALGLVLSACSSAQPEPTTLEEACERGPNFVLSVSSLPVGEEYVTFHFLDHLGDEACEMDRGATPPVVCRYRVLSTPRSFRFTITAQSDRSGSFGCASAVSEIVAMRQMTILRVARHYEADGNCFYTASYPPEP